MRVCPIIRGDDTTQAALASHALGTLLETLGLRHSPTDGGGFRIHTQAAQGAEEAVVTLPCGGAKETNEADILGTTAHWLTGRGEEQAERDPFGRVRGATSPLAKAGLLRTPVVHDLMNRLWATLSRAAEAAGVALQRLPAWPDGRKFAVLLSHDVDLWRKRTARQLAKELLRATKAPSRLTSLLRTFARGPDPWSSLDAIADLEARYGMHSTFFVFAGRPNLRVHGVGVVNSYDAPRELVSETLRRLADRGWEVALHGSYESFGSAERLRSERADLEALLGQPVLGCRQHFLRFAWHTTWQAQAQAGLHYDATLGYHDTDGYRAAFSFPFRPFTAGGILPLIELPVVVCDGALYEHQALSAEAAWDRLKCYLERTEADGAMLGLLWHNTYFSELDAPGYRGVYERALGWVAEHGGWGASAREIAQWWSRRAAALAPRS